MTNPPLSLLQLAQAPLLPSPIERSAVILIDHQLEYLSGALPLAGMAAAIDEAAALLAYARARHAPVFHIVHHGRPGAALFDPARSGVDIIPALSPLEGETSVVKRLPNAFAGTDLLRHLQAAGRPELIIAGFMTHNCVAATAWAALDLGYRTTIVAAATATRDLPDPSGGVVPAARVQAAILAGLADRAAIVVPDMAALIRPR